jgi:hypothetical protein
MSGMTGEERDRILGLLGAGPATVARLAAALGLPGGVVSYQLKLLEREGLARVGTIRSELGVTIGVWVSTAAAAPPPLRIPAVLPGLTWTGDEPYPAPVWTAPRPVELSPAGRGPISLEAAGSEPSEGEGARADEPMPERVVPGDRRPGNWSPRTSFVPTARTAPAPAPQPRRARPAEADQTRSPRLLDVRRVPVDEATFYEFASRLDALAREFADRATPGAPITELTIVLNRPLGEGTAGYGS